MSKSLDFSFAYGGPICTGDFRTVNEDFKVTEELGWVPDGYGEHVYLDITKNGENTGWVAKEIAEFSNVKVNDVGYCGLKDRNAVTRQWFSVYLPVHTNAPEWESLSSSINANIELHQVSRGTKKLRRGQHQYNHFEIVLKNVECGNSERFLEMVEKISQQGVPNYFGEQRFGREGGNLVVAGEWLEQGKKLPRSKKSIIMSAARSYLFNSALSYRVQEGNWNSIVEGDVELEGAPTGPMWGRGRSATTGCALDYEKLALQGVQSWLDGLEHVGLSQERRGFVLQPKNFSAKLESNTISLKFALPPGQYATSILRELAILRVTDF